MHYLLFKLFEYSIFSLGIARVQERCASRLYKTRHRKESSFERWRAVVCNAHISMYSIEGMVCLAYRIFPYALNKCVGSKWMPRL